jgi:hypothetical protein
VSRLEPQCSSSSELFTGVRTHVTVEALLTTGRTGGGGEQAPCSMHLLLLYLFFPAFVHALFLFVLSLYLPFCVLCLLAWLPLPPGDPRGGFGQGGERPSQGSRSSSEPLGSSGFPLPRLTLGRKPTTLGCAYGPPDCNQGSLGCIEGSVLGRTLSERALIIGSPYRKM